MLPNDAGRSKDLIDSNFSCLQTQKAAVGPTGGCASGYYGVESTTTGLRCIALTNIVVLNALGFTPESTANKGQANGYAGLGSDGKVPAGQLPASQGGMTGLVQDTSPQLGGDLDANGFDLGPLTPTDMGYLHGVTSALQPQLDGKAASAHNHDASYEAKNANIQAHVAVTSGNPHGTTKSHVGLGNVENVALSTWTGSTAITTLGTIASGTIPWAVITGAPSGGATAKDLSIEAPSTIDSGKYHVSWSANVTIGRISCSTDTGTASLNLDVRSEATPNTTGTSVLASPLVCDTNSEVTTTFASAAVSAHAPVAVLITATASTPNVVRVHVEAQ